MKRTPKELLDLCTRAFKEGRNVTVATWVRAVVWTPKNVAKSLAEPFRISKDGALTMLEGWTKGKPRYVRITTVDGTLLVNFEVS